MLIGGLRRGGRCMNIALLGGSGVGKTNYICTLFREIRNLSNRYRTNISYQDPDGTVEKYRTINDKLDASYNGGVAPYFCNGTSNSSMLDFNICITNEEEQQCIRFLSYDYAGEHTDDIMREENVKDVLSYCDILFCFLDSIILERAFYNKNRCEIVSSNLPVYVQKLNEISCKKKLDEKLHVSLILTKIDAVKKISEENLIDYVRQIWNSELQSQNCQNVHLLGVYASTIVGNDAVEYTNYQFQIKENIILNPKNILTPLFDSCTKYVHYCQTRQIDFEKISHKVMTKIKEAAKVLHQALKMLNIPVPEKEFLNSCMTTHLGYKIAKKWQFYIEFFEDKKVSNIIRLGL